MRNLNKYLIFIVHFLMLGYYNFLLPVVLYLKIKQQNFYCDFVIFRLLLFKYGLYISL